MAVLMDFSEEALASELGGRSFKLIILNKDSLL
jgi:hypothetical protein